MVLVFGTGSEGEIGKDANGLNVFNQRLNNTWT